MVQDERVGTSIAFRQENRTLAGVSVQVLAGGQGEPVVLLHDFDYINQVSPFLELLARDFSVLVPSHPGFGASELPGHFRSIDDLVYLYLSALRDLFGTEPVHMIGCGLGGWIAAEMAVRCTHHIRDLVLVDAIGIKISEPGQRDIADIFVLSDDELLAAGWADQERGRQLTKFPRMDDVSEEELLAFYRARETVALLAWKPFMHNPRLRSYLARIDVPTLVLWGEHDGIVQPSYGEAYAREMPNAEFKTIAAAGHYPYLETPHSFVAAVTPFLRSHQGSS